jgi:hypothetical protein
MSSFLSATIYWRMISPSLLSTHYHKVFIWSFWAKYNRLMEEPFFDWKKKSVLKGLKRENYSSQSRWYVVFVIRWSSTTVVMVWYTIVVVMLNMKNVISTITRQISFVYFVVLCQMKWFFIKYENEISNC